MGKSTQKTCARGRGKIRKYWCLSAGVGVGFRYAINYSKKEKHFSCPGGIAQEVRGTECSKKKRFKLDSKKISVRIRVMQTGGRLQNYLIRAI